LLGQGTKVLQLTFGRLFCGRNPQIEGGTFHSCDSPQRAARAKQGWGKVRDFGVNHFATGLSCKFLIAPRAPLKSRESPSGVLVQYLLKSLNDICFVFRRKT
jgi:hypothetical protein